jgi:hypothetical protein
MVVMMMMTTIAQQAEAWYHEREKYLSEVFSKIQIGSTQPSHPGGEMGIGMENPTIIANISIFNGGLITVPGVHKAWGNEFVLEHREIAPDEDLAELLDRYVQRIVSLR